MPKKRSRGRAKGRRTKGYFYRAGRGWVASDAGRLAPLTFADGSKIKDRDVADAALKAAYDRWRIAQRQPAAEASRVTVLEVVTAYLKHALANGATKTYHDRADTLFDFAFGLPPEFRDKSNGRAARQPTAQDRIHPGYGERMAGELIPFDLDQWLQAHPTWVGGKKTRIQAVKRAFNYAAGGEVIPANPLRGYRTPRSRPRVTYFTDEQEAALLKHANAKLAVALRVLIRTGARPGIEFAKLTAAHVVDLGDKMEWRFKAHESKTRKDRVIRITDEGIIAIVRQQIARTPKGSIFKNSWHRQWTPGMLSQAFRRTLDRAKRKDKMEFDADVCLYSTRHTYAKRTLQGYWTGRATNIETLARLMGNTPQVCREHYLQWTDTYNEPLWEAC